MKTRFHTTIVTVMSVFLAFSCGQNRTVSLEEAGGMRFPISFPITAIVDAGDSLLVGTQNGKIAVFNTQDYQVSYLRTTCGGSIYDMEIRGDYLYFSGQDNGVMRVRLDAPNEPPVTYVIKGKWTNYSPYDILLSQDGNTLYGATSNGFYRWDTRRPECYGEALKDTANVAPYRFYSVVQGDNQDIIFAGEPGVFRYDGKEVTLLDASAVREIRGDYQLSDSNTSLSKGYGKAEDRVAVFTRDPKSFAVGAGLVYAVSENAIECFDTESKTMRIVELQQEDLSEGRNNSTRATCVVKGAFVYAAPGDEALYRLPARLRESEIITSVASDGNELYALSANKDLYLIGISMAKGKAVFSEPHYIRTLHAHGTVRLLGAEEGTVYARLDNTVHCFKGKREDISLEAPHPQNAGDITCDVFDNGTSLFECRKDILRSYSYLQNHQLSGSKAYDLGKGIHIRPEIPDYYPTSLTKVGNTLIFGTLHNGVYSVDITSDTLEYMCLIDTVSVSRINAIKSIGTTVYVLSENALYRLSLAGSEITKTGEWGLAQFGANGVYFNKILPVANDKVYLYSSYNICRGAYGYILEEMANPLASDTLSRSSSIKDGLFIESLGYPVFCGDMGLFSVGAAIEFPVNRPKHYYLKRAHAETYCWGLALAILALLIVTGLITYSYYEYGRRKVKVEIKKAGEKNLAQVESLERLPRRTIPEMEAVIDGAKGVAEGLHLYEVYSRLAQLSSLAAGEIEIIKEQMERDKRDQLAKDLRIWAGHFKSGYVLSLAEELISMSKDSITLAGNISKFKDDEEKLQTLDDLGEVINQVKALVKGPLMREGSPVIVNQQLKEELDAKYIAKVAEFFSYYAFEDKESSEWGQVFKNAVDKTRPSTHKLSFLMFPLCVEKAVGDWFPTQYCNFVVRKSEWKKGGRPPYSLQNFMKTDNYGLFRLIAGAGLRNLEKEESKERDANQLVNNRLKHEQI